MKLSKLVKKVAKKEEKVKKKSRVATPKTPVKKEAAKKVEKKQAAPKKPVLNAKVTTGILKDKRTTKWMTEKDIAFLDKYIKKSA